MAEDRAEHGGGGDPGRGERRGHRSGAGQDAQPEDERPGGQHDAEEQARLGDQHEGDHRHRDGTGRGLGEHRQAGRREFPATPSTGPPFRSAPDGNETPVSCSDTCQMRRASSALRSRLKSFCSAGGPLMCPNRRGP